MARIRGKAKQIEWMEQFLHDEVTIKIFGKAKIPEGRLMFEIGSVDCLDAKIIKEAYYWLNDLHGTVFVEARRAWKLLPESMWDYYERMDIHDMREQVILNKALGALRKAAVAADKPNFFRKKDREKAIRSAAKAKANA